MATPSNNPLDIPNPGGVHKPVRPQETKIEYGTWNKGKKRLAELLRRGVKERKQYERENPS
jgi:hypothetical protein